jgi:hypothetical protein
LCAVTALSPLIELLSHTAEAWHSMSSRLPRSAQHLIGWANS